MVFGFGRKKKDAAKASDTARSSDPLAAYDGYIEDLDRQAGEVRKSAATLLSLRGSLERDQEKYETQRRAVEQRILDANARHDGKALKVLQGDLEQTERMLKETKDSLLRAETDGSLLLDAAKDLLKQAEDLRAERASAKVRLAAGLAVTQAMRQQLTRVDKVLALDKARDEVERAFALAEVYREDKG